MPDPLPKSQLTLKDHLAALHAIVDRDPSALNQVLEVVCFNPSVGGAAATVVTGIHAGFDWDNGRILISTSEPVLKLPAGENPHRCYEDVECSKVEKGKSGTSVHLKHRSGYVGDQLRTDIKDGQLVRIIPLPPRATRPQRAAKA